MLRNTLTATTLVILGAGALAQSTATPRPVPGVKDGGTYHLATRTWTRGGPTVFRGTHDVIYDNTCQPGYFTAIEQQTFHDDGRIPSTSSPQIDQGALGSGNYQSTSLVGAYDAYTINGLQIGYCTGVVAPVDSLVAFYECFSTDKGRSWTKPVASKIKASGSPGILRRLASGRLVLFWNRFAKNRPRKVGRREELSMSFSDDDGRTWTDPVIVARERSKRQSYPKVFERRPGELWVTTWQGGQFFKLREVDFVSMSVP